MIDILFDKLYKYDRIQEPCYIGIPVKKGELQQADRVQIFQEDKKLSLQTKVTSRHKDGSVRFLFLRFLADLPANKGAVLQCDLHGEKKAERAVNQAAVLVEEDAFEISVSTKCGNGEMPFSFRVRNDSDGIFEQLNAMGRIYEKKQFVGPFLKDSAGNQYRIKLGSWRIVEAGPVCAILKARGSNIGPENRIDFEVKLTAWAGKPWVEVSYRIINTTDAPFHVASLIFSLLRIPESAGRNQFIPMEVKGKLDST